MFPNLFYGLREAGVPVTLREYLDLLAVMEEAFAGDAAAIPAAWLGW